MKHNKRIWLFLLVLTLVFSLSVPPVASAMRVKDSGAVSLGVSDLELQRQDMWEQLNSKIIEIENRFLGENVTGNYFTEYYYRSLSNAVAYAKKLLEIADSDYTQLSDMCDELDYMIKESDNPANHELASHYTVAFTDTMNWGSPVYVYVWNSKGFYEFEWPGMGMTGSYVNEFGQRQYYAYVGEEYDYVVFSNKSQTVDIPLYEKTGYYPTGEVDPSGSYKVSNWHLSAPRYKEYDLDEPIVPVTERPTEFHEEIPRISPENPDEDYINWFVPKQDASVKLKLRANDSQLQSELYNLILSVDSSVAAPGNNYTDDYRERVLRVRDHSASVYNHDSAADHELTGAIKSLQFALDGESWGRIIDCLRYYFIYAEYIEPKDDKFKPGEVIVSIKSGSPGIGTLLNGFEIESERLLTPGSSQKVYLVVFKEKSNDIVYRAIEALNQSEYVEIAEPNFLGAYSVMYLRGDADLDGEVTVLDATRIQRVLASLTSQTSSFEAVCGDVNGDGLDIIDATAIQRYLAGLGNPYGINEEYSLA